MDKRKEHTILGQFHFSVLSMRWAAQIQIQSLYLLVGILQFAIIGLPPFHLFCSYFLLLQIDNSTLWRKNCSYVRKAEQVSQGIHGQVQGQQRKLIVISNWELVFFGVSIYFFPALLTHFTASSKNIVLQYWVITAVTGKFNDFPVCAIRNIFIRKLSHLTISSPFILINQKMYKNHSSF